MRYFVIGFISLLVSFCGYSEVFKFQYQIDQKSRVECTINGKQFINGIFNLTYNQEYKTVSYIKLFENDVATITESFYYYNKNKFSNSEIRELTENIDVTYIKDVQGRMTAENKEPLPTLRNVPFFPEKDVKINEQWESPGYEIQDLFGDKRISVFPIDVDYTFLGYETLNGKEVSKIYYEFKLDIVNSAEFNIDNRILRVNGISKTIMYFDNKLGTRVKELYERDYLFEINDFGTLKYVEFVDKGERFWYPVEMMKKDNIVEELKKEFKDNDIKNTEIEKDDKGIKISLENIQFEPDSAVLRESEIERLNKISEILKKYKERGVLIEGHTTDKGTESGRQKLSLERAKTVTDFLIQKESINPKKSSYTGKGGKNPIASNDTEEGQQKNRRVEIFILEE